MPVLEASPGQTDVVAVLQQYRTESGRTLLELVDESPLLLIFLRHFGCSFCRQTLDDVSKLRSQIEAKAIRPVFVHLGTPERAKPYFDYYHLSDIERVSDPQATLYTQPVFDLERQSAFSHFLVAKVWKAWLQGAIRKHGFGMIKEDGDQMPGIFFLRQRAIVRAFRYKTIADEPDYMKLIA
jgi:alkyl-hydroperoxide reductase/thiol specific antioxidant family protein